MVGRAELTQAQEPQKPPNARGPKGQGHWVASEARGPESMPSFLMEGCIRLLHDKTFGLSVTYHTVSC